MRHKLQAINLKVKNEHWKNNDKSFSWVSTINIDLKSSIKVFYHDRFPRVTFGEASCSLRYCLANIYIANEPNGHTSGSCACAIAWHLIHSVLADTFPPCLTKYKGQKWQGPMECWSGSYGMGNIFPNYQSLRSSLLLARAWPHVHIALENQY